MRVFVGSCVCKCFRAQLLYRTTRRSTSFFREKHRREKLTFQNVGPPSDLDSGKTDIEGFRLDQIVKEEKE
jgi:hypothetical protein